ncbi:MULTISPECIES: hypothetical protein [Pseudooceanicola]|uniref:hypothetical protein n=1 Tax=Pseudooceanicola TaxID=1679449 RepID=UPI001EEF84E7|nr:MULTISPECIES: hypothetical protein [Pseudooceanicola]
MIFRLFRLPILLAVAFVAGVLYERSHSVQECGTPGGSAETAAVCELNTPVDQLPGTNAEVER